MQTNTTLYQHSWGACETVKGVVMLIHGLGEHCNRYTALGEFLNQHGYVLSAIDLPGHGQSPGRRGHIEHFSDFAAAALSMVEQLQQTYSEKPFFLLGHSMGGLIATQILLDQQQLFKGALLSGAAIQSPQQPPAWQLWIIKLIAKIFPTMGVLTLDASCISRDPAVVDKYMHDPLVNQGKLSARFLVEMFASMEDCKARAANIELPIKIMHGTGDVMTAPQGSQYLYEHISSLDKDLQLYEGLYHEIFNEPEGEQIFAEIVTWLDSRL